MGRCCIALHTDDVTANALYTSAHINVYDDEVHIQDYKCHQAVQQYSTMRGSKNVKLQWCVMHTYVRMAIQSPSNAAVE